MSKSEINNTPADTAHYIVDNLNTRVMLDHIEDVELGVRVLDEDFFKALRFRQEVDPEVHALKLSPLTEHAIRFASDAHLGQTRKGKNQPYITHPLVVAEILSGIDANENVIAAGLLHDTIEDTNITYGDIEAHFGQEIANIVNDMTEQDKSLPWGVRKQKALEHVSQMDHNSFLVKTADILHNMSEQREDYQKEGDALFDRFKAGKSFQLERYRKLVNALEENWPENPLLPPLKATFDEIDSLWS